MALAARARRRASAAIGASVCALVALAGCTSSAAVDDTPPEPVFHELAVPDELVPSDVQVSDVSVVAGQGKTPVVVAGTRTEPRERPRLAVWSAKPGAKIVDEPQFLETVGAPAEVDLDGGPDLAAVAGYSWDGSSYVPFVFTSDDRREWGPVTIPDDLADLRPVQVAVDGTTAYVVGRDSDDRLVVLRVSDGTSERQELPRSSDTASVSAADADAGTLVIVTSPTASKGDGPEVLTSRDGAGTWEHASLGAGTTVSDAVVPPSGDVVLVGSAYDGTDDRWEIDGWSSADGRRWQRDFGGENYFTGVRDGADSWLGDATIVGDHVVVPLTTEDNRYVQVLSRSKDGTWNVGFDGRALRDDGSSHDADQLMPSVQISHQEGGPAVTVMHGSGVARFFGSDMSPLGSLGDQSPWYVPGATDDAREDAPIEASRVVYEELEEGWRQGPESARYVVDGENLVPSQDESLPTDRQVIGATDPPTGREVALGVGWDPQKETAAVTSWSRNEDGPWTKGVGFDEPYAVAYSLVHDGDRWVAAGFRRDDIGGEDHAAAWASDDGVRWESAGTLRTGERGSVATAACAVPGGGVLAVGSITTGHRTLPVAWRLDGDTWTRHTVKVAGDGTGEATRCVADGESVSVHVDTDGRTQVLSTLDGSRFAPTWTSEEGGSIGTTVTWDDDTVVAAGWMDDERHTGPVLRVTHDGESWGWVPIPTRSTSGVELHRQGGQLVVTTSDDGGVQAWAVDDVERLAELADASDPAPEKDG